MSTASCPMCGKMFPRELLESHANTCLDEQEADALRATEAASKRPRDVVSPHYDCGICHGPCTMDQMYILDECSCKYHRTCASKYAMMEVLTKVTVMCPVCKGAFSVRDYATLCPKDLVVNTKGQTASKRLMSEYRYLQTTDTAKAGFSVATCGDGNLFKWEVKLFGFDASDGVDLASVKQIVMEVTFPENYPRSPPFIRVLRPRFQHMTGHVTIGGSVCTEMLTNQGWSPLNTIEATVVSIRANLIEGGAKVDRRNKSDYTEAEAKDAFTRMVATHGWQH